jgi:hypothetical protein
MPLVANFLVHLCLWALQLNRYHRGLQHKQPAHTTLATRPTTNKHNQTLTTSPHNHPIIASSPCISDWECGACASVNKGGIYCPMCATPCLKCKKVLGAITEDIAAISALANIMSGIPSVVGALPAAQEKKEWEKIAGAPKPVANAVAALLAAVGKRQGQSMVHPRRWQRHQRSVPRRQQILSRPQKWLPRPRLSQRRLVLFIQPVLWWKLLGQRWVTGATLVRITPKTAARCWPRTWWCAFGRCRFRLRGGRRQQSPHIG